MKRKTISKIKVYRNSSLINQSTNIKFKVTLVNKIRKILHPKYEEII